jgi:hypothetical protein
MLRGDMWRALSNWRVQSQILAKRAPLSPRCVLVQVRRVNGFRSQLDEELCGKK